MKNIIYNIQEFINKRNSYWGIISISLSVILTLFILNFFLNILALPNVQGLPILIAPIIAFLGMFIGCIGFFKTKDKLSIFGIIFNAVLFIFPFAFHIIGTIIWGP